MQNRRVVSRVLPELYHAAHLHRLTPFFQAMRVALVEAAPSTVEDPRVVVLSPGTRSETAFDQAFVASLLGYPLLEGSDLLVREGRVWMRVLGRLEQVDVILRRVDSTWMDALELRGGSRLGVTGLLECVRQGTVSVVNTIGSGVLENPALLPFLPELCERLLGEPLRLPVGRHLVVRRPGRAGVRPRPPRRPGRPRGQPRPRPQRRRRRAEPRAARAARGPDRGGAAPLRGPGGAAAVARRPTVPDDPDAAPPTAPGWCGAASCCARSPCAAAAPTPSMLGGLARTNDEDSGGPRAARDRARRRRGQGRLGRQQRGRAHLAHRHHPQPRRGGQRRAARGGVGGDGAARAERPLLVRPLRRARRGPAAARPGQPDGEHRDRRRRPARARARRAAAGADPRQHHVPRLPRAARTTRSRGGRP